MFPNNICLPCSDELMAAYKFRRKCLESNILLHNKLKNYEHGNASTFNQSTPLNLTPGTTEHCCENVVEETYNGTEQNDHQDNVLKTDEYVTENKVFVANDKSKENTNENEDKSYHCDSCNQTFYPKKGQYIHNMTHYPIFKAKSGFLCANCGKSFQTNYILKNHVSKTHYGEKKFKCATCDKKFSDNYSLRLHQRTHTGDKLYQCKTCGMSFIKQNSLTCHHRKHTGERPYVCETCGASFTQKSTLNGHKRTHTGERPFKCDTCDRYFAQRNALNVHMTLHTGKTVKCPDCDKLFSKPSNLILHRRKHTGEKPYSCDKCPNRYTQKCHLDRHIASHLGITFKCDKCYKEFTRKYKYKNHMKSKHGQIIQDEKPIRRGQRYLEADLMSHESRDVSILNKCSV